MLYNVTFNLYDINLYDKSEWLVPYVPYSAADDEDQKTERICFADTIENCIAAIGSCNRDLCTGNWIVVRSVEDYALDPAMLITPQELYETGKVPDALETNEHWYLDEILVHRDIYRIKEFNFEYAVAFSCLKRDDMAYLIDKYDPEHPLGWYESIEHAYDRVVCTLQKQGRYNKSDKFEDEVASLPWAQRVKITRLVLEKEHEDYEIAV